MLYIQNEKWLVSAVLVLRLISHLSGECSLRKGISPLVGDVSQSFIRSLFFFSFSSKKIENITDQKHTNIWAIER